MSDFSVFVLPNLALVIGCMLVLWLISLPTRNASIVDPFWGTGFVIVTWSSFLRAGPATTRGAIVLALVTIWGLRLSIYLLVRNLPHGEDSRYTAMRKAYGPKFRWVSLFTVFLFQGVLLWVLSSPLALAERDRATPLGVVDFVGIGCWVVGFAFEAIGDAQLRAFKKDPASKGKVMDRGLWRFTRHPNYFGEALLGWGYGLLAFSAPGGPFTLLAPAAMTFLLLKISGVALLEKTIVERRPGYREYIEKTSAFVPWPPKR